MARKEFMETASKPDRAVTRKFLLVLWACSGFCTLTMEVVWMRELSRWAGSTVLAATVVTSVFFVCAAAGNLFGAWLTRRRGSPLRVYACFEMCTAVSALGGLLATERMAEGMSRVVEGTAFPVGMALLLAGLPSFFSGVSFPCLAEVFVESPRERSTSGAPFYGMNLLGATVGVVAGGVWLPWWMGIQGTLLVGVAVQMVAGVLAWVVAGKVVALVKRERTGSEEESGWGGWGLLAASGGLSLAAQALILVWVRQAMEGSVYAMTAALAVFVGGLGLGALAAARWRSRGAANRVLLQRFTGAAALALFVLPWVGGELSVTEFAPHGQVPFGLMLGALGHCAIVLGPLTFALGGVFPLAWEAVGVRARGEGDTLGSALALNKCAAAAGGAVCLFLLLPALGLVHATQAIAMGYGALALWARRPSPSWVIVLVVALAGQALLPGRPLGVTTGTQVLDSRCGSYGPVAVVEEAGSRHIVLNSRQRLSGTGRALDSQRHQSWVPLLLSRNARRVCTIGMAAGISADAVLDFPVEHLDAVELVPEVVEVAKRHFEPWNARLFTDPRSRVLVDDGRHILAVGGAGYDAIICDLLFPAEEGTAHLYAREFFELARARLTEGGVFCVWLPAYQLDAGTADLIVSTFLAVFPHAVMARTSLDPLQPVAGVIGSRQPLPFSAPALEGRIEAAGLRGKSPFLRSGRHAQMLLVGDLRAARPAFDVAPVITDDRPVFAWLGPAVNPRDGLIGVRFLNWAGRRFPAAEFPSCEIDSREADDLLLAIRAGNHYLAAAVAATVLPGDARPEAVRETQVRQAMERARAISPERALGLGDLNH